MQGIFTRNVIHRFKIHDKEGRRMLVYGFIALLVVAVAVIGFQYISYKNTLHDK